MNWISFKDNDNLPLDKHIAFYSPRREQQVEFITSMIWGEDKEFHERFTIEDVKKDFTHWMAFEGPK